MFHTVQRSQNDKDKKLKMVVHMPPIYSPSPTPSMLHWRTLDAKNKFQYMIKPFLHIYRRTYIFYLTLCKGLLSFGFTLGTERFVKPLGAQAFMVF